MKSLALSRLTRACLAASAAFAAAGAGASVLALDNGTHWLMTPQTYSGISGDLNLNFPGSTDYFEHVMVRAKSDVTVDGHTAVKAYYAIPDSYLTDIGMTTVFDTEGTGKLTFNGDVDVVLHHEGKPFTRGGSNVFYAAAGGTINATDGNVRAYSIGSKPDLISAKDCGTVKMGAVGKTTQLVGSVDFLGFGGLLKTVLGKGSTVDLTVDGADSFWYGDLQNGDNVSLATTGKAVASTRFGFFPVTKELNMDQEATSADTFGEKLLAQLEQQIENDWLLSGYKDQLLPMLKQELDEQLDPDGGNAGDFNLTVSNGATYTYMGIQDGYDNTPITKTRTVSLGGLTATVKVTLTPTVKVTPKRITNLTLTSGGRVNLYDTDVNNTWRALGLMAMNPGLENVRHDYIRIANLQGNDGVFLLDLNVDNKADSDLVVVENSSGGQFTLEPYNLANLGAVSDTNRLRFATVQGGATFVDKINMHGEKLTDYTLEIGHSPYDENDPENAAYYSRIAADDQLFDPATLLGAENWYITRLSQTVKPGVSAVFDGAKTAYLFGYDVDNFHKRVGESVFTDENPYGLFVRSNWKSERFSGNGKLRQGRLMIGSQFSPEGRSWDAGTFMEFSDGSGSFAEKGDSDLHGWRLGAYHTYLNEGFYTDAVFSMGRTHVKLNADEDFRVNYRHTSMKFGLETGKEYRSQSGWFLRPEAQIQFTYFGKGESETDGVHFKARDFYSSIVRGGLHAGKAWSRGKVSVKGDLLHEFQGKGHVELAKGGETLSHDYSMSGSWFRVGLEGVLFAGERDHLSFTLEHDMGGSDHKANLVNINYRHSF